MDRDPRRRHGALTFGGRAGTLETETVTRGRAEEDHAEWIQQQQKDQDGH
jgi:hypothetical protein